MPAEWARHRATWIAWPHERSDWPGKFEPIPHVYAEITRALSASEKVEIVCTSEEQRHTALQILRDTGVTEHFHIHVCENDRSWLRDSAPTGVITPSGARVWLAWRFNAWAKYENFGRDQSIPNFIAETSQRPAIKATRPDNQAPLVLEGGAIEVDGAGTLLTTEECLLSSIQERNPGLDRHGYELAFKHWLGISKTIWLYRSCEGDDTHGHIDDVARFTSLGHVLLTYEEDPSDPNHEISRENLARLHHSTDARGIPLSVTTLPMPRPITFAGQRLPASYANFYIANTVVLVPTFNDPRDREALNIIARCFPGRTTVGIHAVDLVLGLGTLHCLTQQEPL